VTGGRLTSATGSEEAKSMWSIYTDAVKTYEKQVITAQKDDANSVLVFVSHNFSNLTSVALTGFEDWSLLRSHHRFHRRKL
jgi:hypothetical protein